MFDKMVLLLLRIKCKVLIPILTVAGSSRGFSISDCLKKTLPLEIRHSILSNPGTRSLLITPATNPSRPLIEALCGSSGMSALWAVSRPLASSCSLKKACVFSRTCLSSLSSRKLDFRLTALSLSSLMSPSVFSRCAYKRDSIKKIKKSKLISFQMFPKVPILDHSNCKAVSRISSQ